MKTNLRRLAVCLLALLPAGCKTGAPAAMVGTDPSIVPLPSIEREVLPDGSEIVVAPPADTTTPTDAAAAPRTWSQKFAAFCDPKPPKRSNSNRVYESDNIPYTD